MPGKRERFKRFFCGLLGEERSDEETQSAIPLRDVNAGVRLVDHESTPATAVPPLPSAHDPPNTTMAPADPSPKPTIIENTSQSIVTVPVDETTTYEGWNGLKLFAAVLSKTPDSFGPLKHAADVLVSFIGTFGTTADNRKELQELKGQLDGLFNDLRKYIDTPTPPTITSSIKNLEQGIKKETDLIEQIQQRNKMTRYLSREQDVEDVLKCYRRLEGLFRRLDLNANINTWITVDELATETHLKGLPNSPAASYNSADSTKLKRGGCTQNTRVDVLQELHGWAGGAMPERIYWLNGMAGTGKTTIAYSLSQELEKKQTLAASFFCSRQSPECRNVNRIVPTIAYQLSRFSSPFRHILSSVLKSNPDVYNKPIRDQFEQLITQPVNKVKDALPDNLVVVIDALDECEADTGVADILDVLLSHARDLPLRFFVSSRPDADILDRMGRKQGEHVNTEMRLHELDRTVVQTDIRTYLTAALKPFIEISETDLGTLVERSGVLFIYASTVVRYVGGENFARGTKRLREVVGTSRNVHKGNNAQIDELYAAILRSAFGGMDLIDEDRDEMRLIIHTVMCAQEPLCIDTMAGLLKLDGTNSVKAALRPLFSVLQVSEVGVITTLHESFRDFLLDASRSGGFHCNPDEHHPRLAELCFYHMSVPPPFNICGLESSYVFDKDVPGLNETLNRVVSGELFYACRYWTTHMTLAKDSTRLAEGLLRFLSERLLFWMEIMNLKSVFARGLEMLRELDRLPEVVGKGGERAGARWMEVHGHLLFKPAASEYATHLRIRSVALAGGQSDDETLHAGAITHHQYCKSAPNEGATSHIWSVYDSRWVGQPLEGHTNSVTSVAYSPDGAYIVSGSYDRTVRIWYAQNGEQVGQPLEGHTSWVTSVAYSPDGAYIVSGSEDRTVRIWNAQNGEQVGQPLEGHTNLVRSVAYSPDGAYIVSGSYDSTVRIWNAQNGEQVGQPLEGRTSLVTSVAYSPDGAYIVSGSYDSTVRIWNAQNGEQVGQPLEGNTSSVTSVAYSPDGAYIVSGSYDRT
ncbi:hypothetical protein FRC07_013599, partial [Ceratobasidium sp. 392]